MKLSTGKHIFSYPHVDNSHRVPVDNVDNSNFWHIYAPSSLWITSKKAPIFTPKLWITQNFTLLLYTKNKLFLPLFF